MLHGGRGVDLWMAATSSGDGVAVRFDEDVEAGQFPPGFVRQDCSKFNNVRCRGGSGLCSPSAVRWFRVEEQVMSVESGFVGRS